MSPIHIPIELGVGSSHPSNKSNMTQIGTFVLVILTSSTVFASTSFCIWVWMMSRPASCRFCCATTCWVFSLPAKTFAFTVGPPLLEKGLMPARPQLDNNRIRHRLLVAFLMCHLCGCDCGLTFLAHPDAETACESTHADAYKPALSYRWVRQRHEPVDSLIG